MIYLIPRPDVWETGGPGFLLEYKAYLVLSGGADEKLYRQASLLRERISRITGFSLHLTRGEARKGDVVLEKVPGDGEEYELCINGDGVRISGTERSVIWGIQTFLQILEQTGCLLPGTVIRDKPYFAYRGFYHDVTRGRVPKLSTLKKLADRCSRYKVNQLQLYIEHSYLFRDLTEVWRDDTPLTPEEILELDAYCADRGVELVPSISTCSHLYKLLRTQGYKELCELEDPDRRPHSAWERQEHHTVNICDPRAFKLVKKLLDEYRPLFSSAKFNICADETFDLGRGKSRDYCERHGLGKAYAKYVSQICEYVIGLGCRPMMWGDIIVKYPELLKEFPKETIFLNWGYSPDITEDTSKCFGESGVTFCNCPGVNGWARFVNDNRAAYENIRRMTGYARKYRAAGILNTDWGDYYHFSHPEFSYIGLIYGAQMSWGREMTEEALNRSISTLEFGASGQEGLTEELCAISDNCLYSWMFLCAWKENQDREDVLRQCRGNFGDPEKLERFGPAQENLEKIKRKISAHMASADREKRQLLAAYLLAADGCSLFNRLGRTVSIREFLCGQKSGSALKDLPGQENLGGREGGSGQGSKNLSVGSGEDWALAAELENWFYYYKELYRSISKESELSLLQDVLLWYCDYLRKGRAEQRLPQP